MELQEADYYTKLANGKLLCQLCPHSCQLSEGETGLCRVRQNLKGKLYSLVYGRPSSLAIDPVEKKPLFHFLPGSAVFSIGTAGCNQRCVFCQNWSLSQRGPAQVGTIELSPEQAVQTALGENPNAPVENWFFSPRSPGVKMGKHGVRCPIIAYTYNEPTIFTEYMLAISKLAKKKGIRNVMHSCGLVNPKPLGDILKVLDSANIDLKYFRDEHYRRHSGGYLQPVLNSIKAIHDAGRWMEITTLVVPGLNDDEDHIRDECQWIYKNIGPDHPIHFSRFYPSYKLVDRPPTEVAKLEKAYEIAREEGLKYVYVGNVAGHDTESTFCPKCEKKIIGREGYNITSMDMQKGACKFCGEKIAGVWD